MFFNKDSLSAKVKSLEEEKEILTEEVAILKLKKKIEDEDIKHLVKMTKEKQAIEAERKDMARDKLMAEEIAKIKDEYRDKLEKDLRDRGTEIKGMYGEILARLPNITARLKGEL